jgi:hypothetical protein
MPASSAARDPIGCEEMCMENPWCIVAPRGGAVRVNWCRCDVHHVIFEVEPFAIRDLESRTRAGFANKGDSR